MKALVKKYAKEGLWLEDMPEPEVGNNDVLIKIKKTAICGTDVHIYNWDEWAQRTIPVPMITPRVCRRGLSTIAGCSWRACSTRIEGDRRVGICRV